MSEPTKRSAGAVLLELLGKVPDAATLELLLEPEHLARLVRAYGLVEDELRAPKSSARMPGELLLAVLALEPDTAVLLASLGNPAPKPAARRAPTPAGAPGVSVARLRVAAQVAFGLLLALPSGFYLFVRLDVLHVPGLIRYFPEAYALLAMVLIMGLYLVAAGLAGLRRAKKSPAGSDGAR
jgi:hypothetical protein